MQIFQTTEKLQKYISSLNVKIGFVPTMGALHEGHVSLIKRAKIENEIVIVSIFVNPTQFLAGEDFSKYPRKEEADIKICELSGVDILFMPNINDIYSHDEASIIAPKIKGFALEGFYRPGHFDGVLTVVLKLLNLSKAANAYFGEKDAQQLALIKQMVSNFYMSVNIIACPTLREDDGLALSSRNIYLSQNDRVEALKISRALFYASSLISAGHVSASYIKNEILKILQGLNVDYVAITDLKLDEIQEIKLGDTLILVAARVGSVRLIDNLKL